jgi:heme A synthase
MIGIRRLSYVALVIAFAQIVFGAIVRISGSGMGCGDHWPRCNGAWIPDITGSAVVIEVSHRYGALAISLAVTALVILALVRRREPGVSGPGGVLRPALLALALVVSAALLGAVTVIMKLPPQIVVAHLALAMSLLATIAAVSVRAGGFGAATLNGNTPRTARGALAAAIMVMVVVIMGGLTANLPGAATACRGFPHCGIAMIGGGALHVHLTHRVLAILLVLHVAGVVVGVTRRQEPSAVKTSSRITLALLLIQVAIAVMLVTANPTPAMRSLHQATGTAAFLATVLFALIARRGAAAASRVPVGASLTPVEARA